MVAFAENQRGETRISDISPQLTTGGGKPGQGYPAALAIRTANTGANGHGISDKAHTLDRANGQGVMAFQESQTGVREYASAGTLRSDAPGSQPCGTLVNHTVPRRLTPRECERLQGFPDDFTRWDVSGKEVADGPRYRMLGNSMAVPVIQWILSRLPREVSQ